MDFGKIMMRKLIISRIKKRIGVDKFINLKFTVHGDGKVEVVVNLEKHPDQTLDKEELKEIKNHIGEFDMLEGEIEQTGINFKIQKNGKWQEIHF